MGVSNAVAFSPDSVDDARLARYEIRETMQLFIDTGVSNRRSCVAREE